MGLHYYLLCFQSVLDRKVVLQHGTGYPDGVIAIQARLQQLAEDRQHAEIAADRKSQVGTGDRAEKIRTYNYPQNRVSDHRIGLSSYNLTSVVDGDLDEFIDGLAMAEQAEKLASLEIA